MYPIHCCIIKRIIYYLDSFDIYISTFFLSIFLCQQLNDSFLPQCVRRLFELKDVSGKQVSTGRVHVLSLLPHQRAQCSVSGQNFIVELHPPFGVFGGQLGRASVWAQVVPLIDSIWGEEVGDGAKPQRHRVSDTSKQRGPTVEPKHLL